MAEKLALVLGATGGIGGEVARRLVAAGWRVRAMHRDPASRRGDARFEWVKGDAMNRADVTAAADSLMVSVTEINRAELRALTSAAQLE